MINATTGYLKGVGKSGEKDGLATSARSQDCFLDDQRCQRWREVPWLAVLGGLWQLMSTVRRQDRSGIVTGFRRSSCRSISIIRN